MVSLFFLEYQVLFFGVSNNDPLVTTPSYDNYNECSDTEIHSSNHSDYVLCDAVGRYFIIFRHFYDSDWHDARLNLCEVQVTAGKVGLNFNVSKSYWYFGLRI